jgi:cytochrome o ubiquinol oxidase subunit 2
MNQMMAIDAGGGLGLDGLDRLAMPRRGDPRRGVYVSAEVCEAPLARGPLDDLIVGVRSAP